MKINIKKICVRLCLTAVSIIFLCLPTLAQTKPLIKRTIYKTEKIDFGVGGTLAVIGAPNGSIVIEGWQKNEVEISAEIEMQAETESDLALLSQVNGFTIDDSLGRVSIQSVGVYDKRHVKRAAKNFPKNLLAMPLRIDYRIKVPIYTDLEIDGGNGNFEVTNVQSAMRIKFLESNAKLTLTGGAVMATFGSGIIDVNIASTSWRGQMADVQLAKGEMNVTMPPAINVDIEASVLRTGNIENTFESLKPRDRSKFTEKAMQARAGSGGAQLSFTVGDGTLKLQKAELLKAAN